MEIRPILSQPVHTILPQKSGPAASPGTGPQKPPRSDRLELSQELREKLSEQQKAHMAELAQVEKDAKAAQEQAEAQAEAFKVLMRCIKIAGRIISGDIVPSEDEQYLLENEPKMYQMAVAARTPKEDPEEWDSVLEDEEDASDSEASSGETPALSPPSGGEAPPAPDVPAEAPVAEG